MTSQAKVYVAVIASLTEDGNIFPRKLRWEDTSNSLYFGGVETQKGECRIGSRIFRFLFKVHLCLD